MTSSALGTSLTAYAKDHLAATPLGVLNTQLAGLTRAIEEVGSRLGNRHCEDSFKRVVFETNPDGSQYASVAFRGELFKNEQGYDSLPYHVLNTYAHRHGGVFPHRHVTGATMVLSANDSQRGKGTLSSLLNDMPLEHFKESDPFAIVEACAVKGLRLRGASIFGANFFPNSVAEISALESSNVGRKGIDWNVNSSAVSVGFGTGSSAQKAFGNSDGWVTAHRLPDLASPSPPLSTASIVAYPTGGESFRSNYNLETGRLFREGATPEQQGLFNRLLESMASYCSNSVTAVRTAFPSS